MRASNVLPLACLLAAASAPANANIDIVFDYSYDSGGFFSDSLRKNLLNSAANVFESRITDTLTAIESNGSNNFSLSIFNPSTGNNATISAADIALNEIRIYVGGDSLGGSTLGEGGPGGFSASGTQSFLNSLARGQTGTTSATATDSAPWGGMISFNSSFANWYFDSTLATSNDISGYDFYSVALHEISHVLGFGTADSWNDHISGICSTGPCSLLGHVLATHDKSHWAEGTSSTINGAGSFEAAMDPSLPSNTRKSFSDLDWQGLSAVGWQVASVPEPATWAMLLAGLGLVGFAAKRRQD